MKRIFLLLLCSLFQLNGHTIVFVHIGEEIPPYTEVAMKQAAYFNPSTEIILLANQKALETFSLPNSPHISSFYLEDLTSTPHHNYFKKRFRGNKDFRNGFWIYTTERFFYLEELMKEKQLTDVIHLENDVLLYADLENYLPLFQNFYPHMAGTFDNDGRCIAGIFYTSSAKSLSVLTKYFAEKQEKKKNDMVLIAQFRNEYGTAFIDHLPIVPKAYTELFPLSSTIGQTTTRPDSYSLHYDHFQAIFDAAALGHYLGGQDPRNGPCTPGFINESCLFNPSHFTFTWEEDAQGKKIPVAILNDQKTPIINLHIHSKNLWQFSSYRE